MVDVATLQSGLAAMGGSTVDALTVIVRVRDELEKMTANALLLSQKENLAKGAFDNWTGIIASLSSRLDVVSAAAQAGYSESFDSWDEVKIVAVDTANASNQLETQLTNEGKTSIPTWVAVGMLLAAALYYEWSHRA